MVHDVAVCGVEYIAVVERILVDAAVSEAFPEAQAKHPFGTGKVVGQNNAVVFLRPHVGIAVIFGIGVGLVHGRVQGVDARPADAHVVAQRQVAGL